MPNSAQSNAFYGSLNTGQGLIKDAFGNNIVVGANMPGGAGSGNTLISDASGNLTLQSFPGLARQATTGAAGYALVNNTGNIITWAVPNDGLLHSLVIYSTVVIASAATGGQLAVSWTKPDGTTFLSNFLSANAAQGTQTPGFNATVKAGTTVSLTQNTALTGGTASTWAEIWGN